MQAPQQQGRKERGVLFAQSPSHDLRWWGELDDAFRPAGLAVYRAHSGPETIRWIERGGIAGAVLVADRQRINGLSLLHIIRSIDAELPCWLVTHAPTRPTLEAALALRATCVMNNLPPARELALAVRRLLVN